MKKFASLSSLSEMDKSELLYRVLNASIAGLALYQIITDPSKCPLEFLPDAAIHAYEAMFPNSLNDIGLALNLLRGSQAGIAAVTNVTIIPCVTAFHTCVNMAAGFTDAGVHALNAARRASHLASDIQSGAKTAVGTVCSFLPSWNNKRKAVNEEAQNTADVANVKKAKMS